MLKIKTMNKERLKSCIDWIEKNPEKHNQETIYKEQDETQPLTFCIAGVALILAKEKIDKKLNDNNWVNAKRVLDLNQEEANYMFSNRRTIEDFKELLNN